METHWFHESFKLSCFFPLCHWFISVKVSETNPHILLVFREALYFVRKCYSTSIFLFFRLPVIYFPLNILQLDSVKKTGRGQG